MVQQKGMIRHSLFVAVRLLPSFPRCGWVAKLCYYIFLVEMVTCKFERPFTAI
jgi:hypothetical protein